VADPAVWGDAGGWRARLQLQFAKRHHRTIINHRSHCGPLRIQRPFYPEGEGVCHVYVLHPPGGVASGDHLQLSATLSNSASALMTQPGATKCYRGPVECVIENRFQCYPHSILEWLPQETILFNGSRSRLSTRVDLVDDARFIGWEVCVAGRPAAGEGFDQGSYYQSFELWREGEPLWLERNRVDAGYGQLGAAWGWAGCSCVGTMVATMKDPRLQTRLLEWLAKHPQLSASQLKDVWVCRYLGDSAEQAKDLFKQVWRQLRPLMLQRSACNPRIWLS